MRLLIALLSLCTLAAPAKAETASAPLSASSATSDYGTRVMLESTLEKRIQGALTEMLGTENVFVTVNLTVGSDESAAGDEVLPGVPIKDASLRASMARVSKITSVVFVEEGLAEKDMGLVREVTGGILGLDAKRGDTLEVRQQRFRDRESMREGSFTLEKLLRPPHLWHVAWLTLALVAVLALPRGLASSLRSLAEAVNHLHDNPSGQGGGAGEGRQAADPLAALPAGGPAPAAQAGPAHMEHNRRSSDRDGRDRAGFPFGFIREGHFQRLMYLLRKSPPEIAAVVVNYLPSDMASRVLGALEPEQRQAVTMALGQVIELSEINVRRIEQMVVSKIDFLVGGEDRLLEILDGAAPDVQASILDNLGSKDPGLVAALRKRLVQVSDIGDLESVEIQHVMRRIPMATLAPVLHAHPEVVHKMAEKLPEGLSQRLVQEVDLTRPLPPERLRKESHRVVEALKALAIEGWIGLKKGPATVAVHAPDDAPKAQG